MFFSFLCDVEERDHRQQPEPLISAVRAIKANAATQTLCCYERAPHLSGAPPSPTCPSGAPLIRRESVEDPREPVARALQFADWIARSQRKVQDMVEMSPKDAAKASAQKPLDLLNQDPQARLLTADEMAEYADRNRSWPSEAAREGRLISVRHAEETYYPAFQIDPVHREPWDWVSTMARILKNEGVTGRSFTLWAATPSSRFGGDTPAVHTGDPDFMVKAAADLAEL